MGLYERFMYKDTNGDLWNVVKTYKLLLDHEGEDHNPESDNYTGYQAFNELQYHASLYYEDVNIPEGMRL